MKQEYKIMDFVMDLEQQDKRVFLPVGAQILEVYYVATDPARSMICPIGGRDRLILFTELKNEFKDNPPWVLSDSVERLHCRSFGFPNPLIYTEIRMVIKALVPAPKPKGKYA